MNKRGWVFGVGLSVIVAFVGCSGGSARLTPSFVAVHNTMTAMGLAQSGDINEGVLAQGGVARVTMPLRGGECYTLVAFGSDGVADIDVMVLDDAGTEVARDRTQDSQAAAQFCPDADGEYQVAVAMARGGGGYAVTAWSGAPSGGGVASGPRRGGRGSCQAPIALEIGVPVRGNTSEGGAQMTGSCIRGGEAPEQVYALTLERRAQVEAVLSSDYDGALYILGTCGEMRSEIGCNDDAGSTTRSLVQITLDPGTYYVVVDGFGNESGEYELQVSATDLQNVAQVCAAAPVLRPGQAVTGSTAGLPNYFQATCAGGAGSPDRVYALDVPARSRARVRMLTSNYDGALYLRRQCEAANSEVACNDDHIDTRHSMVSAVLDPGRYFVYADGFSTGNQGDYSLRADLAPAGGGTATGDACAAPAPLDVARGADIDTFPAADDLAGSCGGQGAPDVVYRVDVQNRSRLRASLRDADFPVVVYLQRQCGSSELACVAAQQGQPTEVSATVTPGTYFVVVDGVAADNFGAAHLDVRLDDVAALERACNQAPRVTVGRDMRGDTSSGANRFQATCAGNAASNDLVYRLVLTRRQRVRITSEQQYDGAIYLRTSCLDQSTEIACNDDSGDNRHSLIETELDRGTYFLFIDGFAAQSQGAFTFRVTTSNP